MAAQLEDGYTPIAHEILEALFKTRINGSQANIIMFILRYTYGFHRKSHEMGNSFIAEGTGIRKDQIKKELNKLIEMKIIRVFEESTHIKARVIGINTRVSEWAVNTKSTQGGKSTPGVQIEPSVGGKTPPPPGGQLPPQDIYSFKNNFKDISTTTDDEVSVSSTYTKVFGPLSMTGLISDFVMKLKNKGYPDSFIIELMLETGESSNGKPSLKFMNSIAERWIEKGINSREENRADKEKSKQNAPIPFNKYRKPDKPSIPIAVGETHGAGPSDEEFEEMMRAAAEMAATKKER